MIPRQGRAEAPGREPPPYGDAESLLIAADEVATMMGISTRTLWRLLSAGRLPAPIRIGGSTRWRRRDILAWIETGCPEPGPKAEASR